MDRHLMVEELVDFFLSEHFIIHGAKGVEGMKPPLMIMNDGYGDSQPRTPDILGMDKEKRRVVFGVVKCERNDLDTEEALTEYNVFLDHRAEKGAEASVLYVLLPSELLNEFTDIITHYIHREYWHRILPIVSKHHLNPNG